MRDSTEILLETSLMSALNIAAVYIAAFTYRLNIELLDAYMCGWVGGGGARAARDIV
jgi:hypothetical protein